MSIISKEDPDVDYSVPNDIVAAFQAFYSQFNACNEAHVARFKPFLLQTALPNYKELQWNELKHPLDNFCNISISIVPNLLSLGQ